MFPASLSAYNCQHFMPTVVCPCAQLLLLSVSRKNVHMMSYGTSLPDSASTHLTRHLYFPGQPLQANTSQEWASHRSRAPKLVISPRPLEPYMQSLGTYVVHGPGRRGRCLWQLGTAAVPSVSLFRPTLTLAPPQGVVLMRWVTRFSLGRAFFPLVLTPALHGRPFPVCLSPLPPRLHEGSALPVICFPEPLFALAHTHTESHSTAPIGCSLPFPPYRRYRCRIHRCYRCEQFAAHRCYRCGTFAAQARQKLADHPPEFAHLKAHQSAFSHGTANTAWPGFFLRIFLQVPPSRPSWKGMVLPYLVVLVLGAAAPARAVAHNSYFGLSEYDITVLLSCLRGLASYGGRLLLGN
jgi:hypothetical protein